MHPPRTLNIGILAHVDAGKTSLTERLLFDTGVIRTLGSVDAGTTRTDTSAIERRRGITVRSAVVSFTHRGRQVNVIDTPGHADFVAEVERALGVLDAAVLVVSAVEGVQPHTRLLSRTLRALRVPTLIFVNKIDRRGARTEELLAGIRRRLTPHVLAMTDVHGIGTAAAQAVPRTVRTPGFGDAIAERLAEIDDRVLSRVVDGPPLTDDELTRMPAEQTANAQLWPVYFGSARSGEGIAALLDGITELRPPDPDGADPESPHGTVFALERSASGTKTAYLRLFSGSLAVRGQVALERRGHDGTLNRYRGRITSLRVIGSPEAKELTAGNIGTITGPADIRVGDRLAGTDSTAPEHFSPPILRTEVRARTGPAADLHRALQLLTEQDPLLHVRTEPDGATSILLYGEVQKQIIAATLGEEFGIDAEFRDSEPICLERVSGTGTAVEEMGSGPRVRTVSGPPSACASNRCPPVLACASATRPSSALCRAPSTTPSSSRSAPGSGTDRAAGRSPTVSSLSPIAVSSDRSARRRTSARSPRWCSTAPCARPEPCCSNPATNSKSPRPQRHSLRSPSPWPRSAPISGTPPRTPPSA